MTKAFAIIVALTVAASGIAKGVTGPAEIQLEVKASKRRYHLGDDVTITLKFRNISQRSLRLFPDPEQYDIRTLLLTNLGHGGTPKPLQFVELSTYLDSWAKDMITLRPGGASTWTIKAQFRDHLPSDWTDSKPGAYLIFYGGTAFSLSGFGRYSIAANYSFDRDHRVLEYIPTTGPPIWFGKLTSAPIVVEFEK